MLEKSYTDPVTVCLQGSAAAESEAIKHRDKERARYKISSRDIFGFKLILLRVTMVFDIMYSNRMFGCNGN